MLILGKKPLMLLNDAQVEALNVQNDLHKQLHTLQVHHRSFLMMYIKRNKALFPSS